MKRWLEEERGEAFLRKKRDAACETDLAKLFTNGTRLGSQLCTQPRDALRVVLLGRNVILQGRRPGDG
jgi:hypothetical protein